MDAGTLERLLGEQGLALSRRSIQRELVALSSTFPLVCDSASKPFGWSWARDAAPFDLPAMDPRTALTLVLVRQHLAPLLPRSTLKALEPHLKRAEQLLAGLGTLGRWPERLRVLPDSVPEVAPSIPESVLDAVMTAVLEERGLTLNYRGRADEEVRVREVEPLGMVFRGPLVYLVGSVGSESEPRTWLLSRATDAHVLPRARKAPEGFDLDAFLERGHPGFPFAADRVRLVARVQRGAAQRLLEAPPVHAEVTDDGEDHVRLEAEWTHTRVTRAWLLGFGSALTVIEPGWLRDELAAEHRAALAAYGKP